MRGRLERDREYEEYLDKDHMNTHVMPHHLQSGGVGDDYRDNIRPLERLRDPRSREEEFPTHRGSSRRALNAI